MNLSKVLLRNNHFLKEFLVQKLIILNAYVNFIKLIHRIIFLKFPKKASIIKLLILT